MKIPVEIIHKRTIELAVLYGILGLDWKYYIGTDREWELRLELRRN